MLEIIEKNFIKDFNARLINVRLTIAQCIFI